MKMTINGKTKIFALLGDPVEHTASCAMHNAAFRALKINGAYVAFRVKSQDLKEAIEAIRVLNIKGVNITIPHKERCIQFLDKIDPQAKAIGAVNTILNTNGKLTGFNTDAQGVIDSLKIDAKFNPSGKNVFIIGAGGASRAVSFTLAKNKSKSITLVDIRNYKAKSLVSSLRDIHRDCRIQFIPFNNKSKIKEAIKYSDLFINATGLGLKKNDTLVIDPAFLHKGLLVYDLIYNPPQPKLLKVASKKRIKTLNGEGLLLYQGIRAFKIWININPPKSVMRNALRETLRKKQ